MSAQPSSTTPKNWSEFVQFVKRAIEDTEQAGGVWSMLADLLGDYVPHRERSSSFVRQPSPYDKGEFKELSGLARDQFLVWGLGELASIGQPVQQWAELVEGGAVHGEVFSQAYAKAMQAKLPSNAERYGYTLSMFGMYPRNRTLEVIRRGTVTITVLIAKQGDDLYVSCRSYVQGFLNWVRIAVLVLLAFVGMFIGARVGNPAAYGLSYASYTPDLFAYLWAFLICAIALFGYFGWQGFSRTTDPLGWFRDPVMPLQQDDIYSLTLAVQRAIVTAAEIAEVDLLTHQPTHFAGLRRKPLI